MTLQEARQLKGALEQRLATMGLIDPARMSAGVPSGYGVVNIGVDHPTPKGTPHRRRSYIPEADKNYGVAVTTGEYRHSNPPRKKKIHHALDTAVAQIVKEVNAHRDHLVHRDTRKLEKATKDFNRGWCAHRRGLACKLVGGNFHVLVKVGDEEVWQNDVEYSTSHDTLVFKSDIGKVNRWVTIETLQLLLDRGALLNPADVKFS